MAKKTKVVEVLTSKLATQAVASWKRWSGIPVTKRKLASGRYGVYLDAAKLNPAQRRVLGL